MSETDRDRLVALRKAKDRKITQRAAAEELNLSERQVRLLLAKLRDIDEIMTLGITLSDAHRNRIRHPRQPNRI